MTTMRALVIVAVLASASMARAGAYDARRQEMLNWVSTADFGNPGRRDYVKRYIEDYSSAMDGALSSLGTALDGDSDYKSRWNEGNQKVREGFRSFQSNMETAYREETNEKVKKDLLRLVGEEQALMNSLAATEGVGTGADGLDRVRVDIERTRTFVLDAKMPTLIRNGTELSRIGAEAFATLRTGSETFKSALIDVRARSRDLLQACIAAIAKVLGNAFSELELLRSDYKTWNGRIDDYRRTHNEAIVKIAEAMCGGEEWEVDLLGIAMSDQVQRQLKPVYEELKEAGEGFQRRIDHMPSTTTHKEAADLRDTITKKLESMRKTVDYGVLAGSVNPNIRTRAAYGVSKHQSEQSSCAEKEVVLDHCDHEKPSVGCRIDCVNVRSGVCQIVEIKPKGIKAERDGIGQALAYKKSLLELFDEAKPDNKDHPFFSKSSGKFGVFKGCFDEQAHTLRVESLLQTYDFCPLDPAAIARILEW